MKKMENNLLATQENTNQDFDLEQWNNNILLITVILYFLLQLLILIWALVIQNDQILILYAYYLTILYLCT